MPGENLPPPTRTNDSLNGTRNRASHLRLVGDVEPRAISEPGVRAWARWALDLLETERAAAPETPLIRIPAPEFPGIHLMLKDESRHPSGSLKHRLARALFEEGIASGAIGQGSQIVEGSSGSTAIADAWFAKKLGLTFTAVVPRSTAPRKIAAIDANGGRVVLAPAGVDLDTHARDFAAAQGAHYMDQFARAADAVDWRGASNIAARLLAQLQSLGLGAPAWIVSGAGTGGTAATIGRYLRTRAGNEDTRLCVVDPEGSAYFRSFATGGADTSGMASVVTEGIGRGRVGPAFLPGVIDHMIAVSDEGSVSGAHWLERRSARRFGPSTGTNVIGALMLAQAMHRAGEKGAIAFLGNDGGDRYVETIYDSDWCAGHALTCGGWRSLLGKLGEPVFPAAY